MVPGLTGTNRPEGPGRQGADSEYHAYRQAFSARHRVRVGLGRRQLFDEAVLVQRTPGPCTGGKRGAPTDDIALRRLGARRRHL